MNNFDPTDLETTFKTLVKNTVASSTVYNNRPKVATKADDFIVVALASGIEDVASYGECHLEVSLFAKDVQGIKNSVKLGQMYQKLITRLPKSYGKYIVDQNPQILGDVPDDFDFHARVIQFKIIIKVR